MEERVLPPGEPPSKPGAAFRPGTYMVQPNSPTFFIEHFVLSNMNDHLRNHFPKYDIVLKTKNPDSGIGIDYSSGGSASLSFKQQKMATGNPQVLDQGVKETKGFRLVLVGPNAVLPSEVQKSIKDRASISLFLSINVPVKMKIGVLKTWTIDMDISCNLKVNTLAKNTKILSQECHTMI
ncbi:hypothetical protein BVC80_1815g6 [Macleaya cordata]|uniref:Late embryogenesis abundant protein LEA-2 subgroup domain-containing protein n=1 Tax=Macleaya cordata TaxID=56857 RepID=A0A200QVY5_MACCD|nr:hypothetical protein BVC80_1815g6 [Macleaya cordata]